MTEKKKKVKRIIIGSNLKKYCPDFRLVGNREKKNPVIRVNRKEKTIEYNIDLFRMLTEPQKYLLIRWAYHDYRENDRFKADEKALQDYIRMGFDRNEIGTLFMHKLPFNSLELNKRVKNMVEAAQKIGLK